MKVLHLIVKGEPCKGEVLLEVARALGPAGASVSKGYLSDPSTYRLSLSFLDRAAIDLNAIKAKLAEAGFSLVGQVQ
jgi:hypothetical protein